MDRERGEGSKASYSARARHIPSLQFGTLQCSTTSRSKRVGVVLQEGERTAIYYAVAVNQLQGKYGKRGAGRCRREGTSSFLLSSLVSPPPTHTFRKNGGGRRRRVGVWRRKGRSIESLCLHGKKILEATGGGGGGGGTN